MFAVFLFFGFKSAQLKTISGIVVASEDGLAIPGVSIISYPSKRSVSTTKDGKFTLQVETTDTAFRVAYLGYDTQTLQIGSKIYYHIRLKPDTKSLNEVVIVGYGTTQKTALLGAVVTQQTQQVTLAGKVAGVSVSNRAKQKTTKFPAPTVLYDQQTNESYSGITENKFKNPSKEALSTFSIDVDAASYSNVRRFLNNGGLPPKDAVRIEEMVNYFDYDYQQPSGDDPVNIITEIAPAPWNPAHRLVHIGLQAKTIPTADLPASNLVFLIDVSGSMGDANKLPLLVSSFKLLTDQLREKDKVAIVVYAGNSGLVLPSTPGDQKTAIKEALNKLSAGGSTAGGEGIELAYKIATQCFIKGGNNRVILATDGDFNVGASSDKDMEQLIEEKRKSGVFLSVLGYGMGNYKDSKMEVLADKGNGNYAYIDNITEARKVLVNEFGGTLFTLAKDVKLQLEFNPAKVQAYRLIGYENRMLKDEDFNDDKKDAGELGSGHTVTALYEIIPVGVKSKFTTSVDELKYQKTKKAAKIENDNPEMLTIKLRYKQPDGNTSKKIEHAVIDHGTEKTSDNFKFSAAVAEFGMLLRQSDFRQESSFAQVIALAEKSLGKDKEGYRSEFLKLAKSTSLMAKDLLSIVDNNGNQDAGKNKR